MSNLVLHAYDASPFTQRVLRMFGVKDLAWRWVETPMMPPKSNLTDLTGGYRGTPVLQVGRDVYIDSQLIARELERRHPHPSLFPNGDPGTTLALDTWSDAIFRAGLTIILSHTASSWPEAFRRDREHLFMNMRFDGVGADLAHARSQYRAHVSLLETQLSDGRAFLGGAQPGLADANAHPFLWMMRGVLPQIAAELVIDMPSVCNWERRVADLGEGYREPLGAAQSIAELEHAEAIAPPQIDEHDAQGLKAGMKIRVTPADTRRGDVEGEVHIAQPNEIAVLRRDPRGNEVLVHFPRLGYRIAPVTEVP